MKTIKLLSLLLALSLLFSFLPFAVSCGDGDKNNWNSDENNEQDENADSSDKDGTSVPDDNGEGEEEDSDGSIILDGKPMPYELHLVEGLDYKGEKFNILVPRTSDYCVSRDFAFEYSEQGSDILQDAAFERVLAVNSLYNVDITAVTATTSVVTQAENDIAGKLGTYDLILCELLTVGSLATRGFLADLTEFDGEQIQLDAPWYNYNFVTDMSIGGRLFYVIGDFSIMDNDAIQLIQFNKDLISKFSLDNPYAMVENGTWTIDAMYALCKGRVNDFDKSGSIDQYDEFGFLADHNNHNNLMPLFSGSGCTVSQKDENDLPFLSVNSARTINAIEKIYTLLTDDTTSADCSTFTKFPGYPSAYHYCNTLFMEDRALMRLVTMYAVTQTRSMTSDYGLLPIPKLNEEQTEYYSTYSYYAPAVAIPAYQKEGRTAEGAAAVMEAISYYGKTILMEQYHNVLLKGRIARDEDCRKMLDLIFEASHFDIGVTEDFSGIVSLIKNSLLNGTNSYIQGFDSVKPSAEAEMQAFTDALVPAA